MALNQLLDTRDLRFILFEMLGVDRLTSYEKFSSFDKDTFIATLELAEKVAIEKVYPANAKGDKIGAQYDPKTKKVTSPEPHKEALKAITEASLVGLANDPAFGGSGMPDVIFRAAFDYLFSASVSCTAYCSLLIGCTNLIKNFGTEAHKKTFLEKMIAGEWGGTMCLTEPTAGSDVGALKTKAVKQADGTYLITGNKIFITSGDHDVWPNIVHAVLARIEGDPPGTKGISIFIVPKFRVNADGSLGEWNDVTTTGIEHKMGIKASPTCSLAFGENGKCVGYLMGQERQGMPIMFQMMNEARLDVGQQGLGCASSAYMHAVTYAKNRVQGADPAAKDGKSALIIKHPDVRRMLLWMKSRVEAMRAVTMLAAMSEDLAHCAKGDEAKEAQALLEFLIPIVKAGNTDAAWLVTSEAIQVYGGYGYCSEYPVEQLARDCKVLQVYEGTNGIQSMDLTMRKLLMNPEMFNYRIFRKRIDETIAKAKSVVDPAYAKALEDAAAKMDQVVKHLASVRDAKKMLDIFSVATPLQQAMTQLAHAWMHLWSLSICQPKLETLAGGKTEEKFKAVSKANPEAAYYYGKVLSSRFFLGSELKKFVGAVEQILASDSAKTVVESTEEIFTGALEA